MMKFLINIFNYLKRIFDKNKNYLLLQCIKKNDQTITCEFNELLRLDGNLIKFNIKEIACNINIQESISSRTLFLIGMIYGGHQNSLHEFRAKIIDIKNEEVTLENSNEKIIIAIADLVNDNALIKQINPLDLVKILYPYAYKIGYNTCLSLNESNNEPCQNQVKSTNIVNLF